MRRKQGLSRRDLVKGLGATTVAASLSRVGWSAASYSRVAGANDRIGLGLIGCGGRGQDVMREFLKLGVAVPAVCDPDESRMKQAAKLAGDRTEKVKDFRRLLERKDIDCVQVATPDHWHALPTVLACDAGKDVYVEKPLAYSVAEGRAMVAAAQRTHRIVQIGTQQRSGEHYHRAVALIQSGHLGKVSRVRVWNVWNCTLGEKGGRWASIGNPPDGDPPPGVDYNLWLGPAPRRPFNPNRFHWNYIYFWDYAGGMMTGWGVHHVDVVHWAMGQDAPLSVSAVGGKFVMDDARETPDTLDAFFEYPGFTLQASFYHANARPIEGRDYGVAFYGTQGTMLLTREGFEIWPEGDPTQAIRSEGSPQDGPFQQEFIECMRSRRKPFADVETGHRSTIPVLLANIAYRTRRRLQWDFERESFVDDEAANRYLRREYRKPWHL
ncbi:MAG: Gfo/Idh/MocA family oxidoreductase [Acidobacteriota bacterium]